MNDRDLQVTPFPVRSPGGQNVGMVRTGVTVVHLPTGISVTVDCERSQWRNRKVAEAMIERGLAEVNWID